MVPLYVDAPDRFAALDCGVYVTRYADAKQALADGVLTGDERDLWQQYVDASGATPPGGQNARVYWEMFDGVKPVGQPDLYVRVVSIDVDVGGYWAHEYPYYQLSVYGRAYLDGPDLDGLWGCELDPGAGETWKNYHTSFPVLIGIDEPEEKQVRCIVVKVERMAGSFADPTSSPPTKQYKDQYGESDPPPWGIRIHAASVFGSSLGNNVRPDLIIRDILDNAGFTYSGPTVDWVVDQMAFVDIPNDRQEGLDEVNGLLGWDYACWDGSEVEFAVPKSGTHWEIDAADPRTTWAVTESLDETYNAVRVKYGNKRGKLREVIVHGDQSAIGFTRADTLDAPESIKSLKAATRFGNRYLRSHETRQVAGTLTIRGDDGVCDPLLIRPGDTIKMTGPAKFLSGTHEVTAVTLNPLEWEARVQFGTNSKRFDTWLARLAAGKRMKRR